MSAGTTVCFYLLLGFGVAAALWIGNDSKSGASGFFQIFSAPLFWPIYIPVLLARRTNQSDFTDLVACTVPAKSETDVMATLIAQVESELDTALRGLNGWAENVLSGEQQRIAELRNAWRQQAGHIRELDQLLNQTTTGSQASTPDHPSSDKPDVSSQSPFSGSDQTGETNERAEEIPSRILEHERSRFENIVRLKEVRRQMYDDLISSLAWVRELVTMIHLAKFSGAPASQALDLVRKIAAAVECLSIVNRLT